MKIQQGFLIPFVIAGVLCMTGIGLASVPRYISYQGKATDASGNPVRDSTYNARFYIYDRPTNGTILWGEFGATVTTSEGYFTHLLGSINPIPDSLFARYDSLYIAVMFGYDWLTPRTPMVSTGYAFRVNSLDGAAGGTVTGPVHFGGAVTTDNLSISDSTFRANDIGVRIGDGGSPLSPSLIYVKRNYSVSSPASRTGMSIDLGDPSSGTLIGQKVNLDTSGLGTGNRYGGLFEVSGATNSTADLVGLAGIAGDILQQYGSIGVMGQAYASNLGAEAIGIMGSAYASDAWAGFFLGNVNVTGTLYKSGGAFKIDHPLDPANKYLQHSFVESPDMMNIYNGNVVTDAQGYATVTLPDYFEAVNKDFRYQLTVIGQFAQAIVAEKIANNQFKIRTDKPNVEVSWQVTGIRHDKWADKHRIQVEVDKPARERGKYLYPEDYNQPPEMGVNWNLINKSKGIGNAQHGQQ